MAPRRRRRHDPRHRRRPAQRVVVDNPSGTGRFCGFTPVSASMSLDDVLARLARRVDVVGVVALGTTATGRLGPASDYDLLVVTVEAGELDVEISSIDHRAADILFVGMPTVRRLVREPVAATGRDRDIVRWLVEGRVVVDPTSELVGASEVLRRTDQSLAPPERELFSRWSHLAYNVATNRRYLGAGDETYRRALDLRLLYCLFDTVIDYFWFRGLPWEGEKPAVRWLDTHDPSFVALLELAVAATVTEERMTLYEQLARKACEPVGELWGDGETGGAWSLDAGAPGPGRWEKLLA